MAEERRARDPELLDVLEAHIGVAFTGDVWRVVRDGRDVLQGHASKSRWDPGTFDVLYTSLQREGALAEIYFHLNSQPVFPSKLTSVIWRISVATKRTLKFADLAALAQLGITSESYSSLSYERTQEIADAASFLGFDGIIAPSARSASQNLVLFRDRFSVEELLVRESEAVDWGAFAVERGGRA